MGVDVLCGKDHSSLLVHLKYSFDIELVILLSFSLCSSR